MSSATAGLASRREQRKARTRAAILEAASELFQSQGYEETSIVQLANRADTGVGTVYGHFPSKEAILHEVLRIRSEEAVGAYFASIERGTPAVERVTAALGTFARFIRENRPIILAAVRLADRDGDDGRDAGTWLCQNLHEMMTEGIRRGQVADLPLDATARMLVGTYTMALLGVGIWAGREDDPRTVAELEAITRRLLTPC
ncbi:MAG: hypothetical protein Kow0010_27520 [Dehalococcoidia bacterium]